MYPELQAIFVGDLTISPRIFTITRQSFIDGDLSTTYEIEEKQWVANKSALISALCKVWRQEHNPTWQIQSFIETRLGSSSFGHLKLRLSANHPADSVFVITSNAGDYYIFSAPVNNVCIGPLIDECFVPYWGLASLSQSTKTVDGYSTWTTDGQTFSIEGSYVSEVQLQCNIDLDEHEAWFAMWQNYWLKGKVVTLYLSLEDQYNKRGFFLQLAQNDLEIKYSRVQAQSNKILTTENLSFIQKVFIPDGFYITGEE
jgi:hypothetical protein